MLSLNKERLEPIEVSIPGLRCSQDLTTSVGVIAPACTGTGLVTLLKLKVPNPLLLCEGITPRGNTVCVGAKNGVTASRGLSSPIGFSVTRSCSILEYFSKSLWERPFRCWIALSSVSSPPSKDFTRLFFFFLSNGSSTSLSSSVSVSLSRSSCQLVGAGAKVKKLEKKPFTLPKRPSPSSSYSSSSRDLPLRRSRGARPYGCALCLFFLRAAFMVQTHEK